VLSGSVNYLITAIVHSYAWSEALNHWRKTAKYFELTSQIGGKNLLWMGNYLQETDRQLLANKWQI